MIALTETSGGILLAVKARPGSKKNGVVGMHDGALRVAVNAAPEKGKANDAICKVLAETLQIKRQDLELVRGSTSSEKTFRVTGLTIQSLRERLEKILKDLK